ncbi:MAG TPA: metallophosphoesterase family protein [Mariprofundaceae bacterium]|nr:metallophosphoesterase family protein [Mariprofundaceae bacterium]
MQPLHIAIEEASPETALKWLLHVSTLYLQHAARFNERLDEGLSNFGLDAEGFIYYLDDDFYSWDHFLSFSAMVAGWFRKFADSWLDDATARKFGNKLARRANRIFTGISDADPVRMIYEHLGFQFTAGEASKRLAVCRQSLLHPEKIDEDSVVMNINISSKMPLMPSQMDEEKWFDGDEPVALLADVHANLPALEAVLQQLANENTRRILVTGDVVGYGPHPNECIDRLHDVGAICLRGNHDHIVGSNSVPKTLHGSRKISSEWTIGEVNSSRKTWLRSLALQWHHGPWMALHGAPQDPTFFNAYVYDRTAESNLQWMAERGISYCVHGHSHLQGVYGMKDRISRYYRLAGPGSVLLEGYMLICPGSIGQPRCGTPGSEYAVLYPSEQRIELRRVDYDMERTIADMTTKGLPGDLMQRLRNGQ